MKTRKFMKRKLLRCMTAMAALLATSCSSELALEGVPNNGVDGEEVEVTFSVSAQNVNASMRASNEQSGGGPGQWQDHIGRGENIDMLIYAVYEYNETLNDNNTHYTLLKQYGLGAVNGTDFSSTNKFNDSPAYEASRTHAGQTIVDVSETIQHGNSQSIKLRLMRNKEYYIAFWAQSSNTAAFNTDDLANVKVNYEDAKNNDELRDAFCKVESFSVSPSNLSQTVILTRPMAQINVGATGYYCADRHYSQSKIVLTGVSNTINVITDEITGSATATFDWAPLEKFNSGNSEEYLRVDIDNSGVIEDGKKYNEKEPEGDDLTTATEEFKYLSMCYALVPATTTGIPEGMYTSSVLNQVDFYIGTSTEQTENPQLSITTVPVHRNWRTNILFGFEKTPVPHKISVSIDKSYESDYNGEEGENHVWNDFGGTSSN